MSSSDDEGEQEPSANDAESILVRGEKFIPLGEGAKRLLVNRMTLLRLVQDEKRTTGHQLPAVKHPLTGRIYVNAAFIEGLAKTPDEFFVPLTGVRT